MDTEHRFLHNHPTKEKRLGLDKDHVIVDRDAWETARKCYRPALLLPISPFKDMDISKILDCMKETGVFLYNDPTVIMLKDWFIESDDGNDGIILTAECPNCGDCVVYGDGCVKCKTIFEFK